MLTEYHKDALKTSTQGFAAYRLLLHDLRNATPQVFEDAMRTAYGRMLEWCKVGHHKDLLDNFVEAILLSHKSSSYTTLMGHAKEDEMLNLAWEIFVERKTVYGFTLDQNLIREIGNNRSIVILSTGEMTEFYRRLLERLAGNVFGWKQRGEDGPLGCYSD